MKEFKLTALKKFGVALMFFFGLILFSSTSQAQTAQEIQENIQLLTAHKAKIETMRNETYSTNDPKYGFMTDVMDHIQSGLNLMESGSYQSIPEDFMSDNVWKKIHPSVLEQEYSATQLNTLQQIRAQMISEGKQNTMAYLKADLVLKANGI